MFPFHNSSDCLPWPRQSPAGQVCSLYLVKAAFSFSLSSRTPCFYDLTMSCPGRHKPPTDGKGLGDGRASWKMNSDDPGRGHRSSVFLLSHPHCWPWIFWLAKEGCPPILSVISAKSWGPRGLKTWGYLSRIHSAKSLKGSELFLVPHLRRPEHPCSIGPFPGIRVNEAHVFLPSVRQVALLLLSPSLFWN